jgi:N-acetyl-1-D-myo-inositol-2-amino-2-deoxy-alpha-D-glucopyranoside deacetylase
VDVSAQQLGLMCVHAHPDDEVITTGGVLARAAAEGLRTAVVTCTGGERGEVVGEGMDAAEVCPRLGEVRLEELREALAILGAGEPRMLGYRDSGMLGTEGNDDAGSFWRAPFDEAVGRLVGQIRSFRPAVLVSYDAFGGYGHPDHVQAHRVTLVASEAAAFPLLYPEAGPAWRVPKMYFATFPKSRLFAINGALAELGLPSPFPPADRPEDMLVGTPDERINCAVDVEEQLKLKMRALRAHRSQLAPDSFFLNVPEPLETEAFGTEWFARLRSDVDVPEREQDLFSGLR